MFVFRALSLGTVSMTCLHMTCQGEQQRMQANGLNRKKPTSTEGIALYIPFHCP